MRQKVQLRTYALVCVIILVGFCAMVAALYRVNLQTYTQHVEKVSALASEGIYYQIDSAITRPITVAQTMAQSTLLRDLMEEESDRGDDPAFAQTVQDYLQGYYTRFGYSSIFVISSAHNRYYSYNGAVKTLDFTDPKNAWYDAFLSTQATQRVDVAHNPNAANAKTVFVTCRLSGADGKGLGVVGIGVRMDTIQALLASYEKGFDVRAFLVSHNGEVQVASDDTIPTNTRLSEVQNITERAEELMRTQAGGEFFWGKSAHGRSYIGSRYIPGLAWYLVVEQNTASADHALLQRMIGGSVIVLGVMAGVLATIMVTLRRYNRNILKLTEEAAYASRSLVERATEEMFECILDIDITHDRAANERTTEYIRRLSISPRLPYSQILRIIAERHVQSDFRQGWMQMFSPQSVVAAYKSGTSSLRYDMLITLDGTHYSWTRVIARILHWDQDGSIHLMAYRQDIDAEKRQETHMLDRMQRDAMTGLYDKVAIAEHMRETLRMVPPRSYAFFIIDIDNFKGTNDRFGHAAGDFAIVAFTRTLESSLRESDLIGRVGGDEFAALLPLSSRDVAAQKAEMLVKALSQTILFEGQEIHMSASIGVALSSVSGGNFETLYRHADAALYHTKHSGKNGFAIYGEF